VPDWLLKSRHRPPPLESEDAIDDQERVEETEHQFASPGAALSALAAQAGLGESNPEDSSEGGTEEDLERGAAGAQGLGFLPVAKDLAEHLPKGGRRAPGPTGRKRGKRARN